MRIKETHNLSQKALDDIVQGTNTQVSAAVKSVCVNIANQFQNNAEEDDDEEEDGLQNVTWQTLFEQNSEEVSPFQDLETESKQRQAFKEMFGLVSMKNCLRPGLNVAFYIIINNAPNQILILVDSNEYVWLI